MTAPIRRGTFTASCRCGWTGTYDTPGRASYAKRRHSCEKQAARNESLQRRLDREASIDRAPKPCLHKEANHQHGTNACYKLDGCRCLPCAQAVSEHTRNRERLQAYGRYDKYVDADLVRAHLSDLKAYGIGLKRVSALSGVSTGSLTKIWYGLYNSSIGPRDGLPDEHKVSRPPARRVLTSTAEKILMIEPVAANLAAGQHDHERTPLARLHLQALVALGWSQSKLAHRVDVLPTNFGPIVSGSRTMTRGTVDRVETLFGELCMTLPPEDTHRDRIAASRARGYARARGWLPPLALDDLSLDETTREQDEGVDEAVVDRLIAGQRITASRAEKLEAMRRWRATGRSEKSLCDLHGWKPGRYITREAGAA